MSTEMKTRTWRLSSSPRSEAGWKEANQGKNVPDHLMRQSVWLHCWFYWTKDASNMQNRIFDNSSSMLTSCVESVIDTNQKEKNKLASGYVFFPLEEIL